ncbi:integrase (plasmid) [Fulvitalea axinellae]|uniref:Integrase n=1 Tax=Fulvitalea axinellae TaxID=1182444 RepID=A0AAU9DI88_9BACT|nr:integrase [Fulvitalea axinellae]BDD08075.1 integrase [Fulvitalea axinellae]BDD08097.1 integrase [Fulvitalea axinellae]BDD10840.1 integrase [Fulvitalea axinellae]BDD11461.1 integrase [Fulvitalea axinellae]
MRLLVDPGDKLSIRRQCDCLELYRSSYYYSPKGENAENLELMRLMDRHMIDEPTAGVLRMRSALRDQGFNPSYERVRRLMRKANLYPIYPKKNLSKPGEAKYVYPYLLKEKKVVRKNQVWSIDITYIAMASGFMYMTAIIDVYSRYIVGWGLSNTLEAAASLKVVREAVEIHGKPEILNSDQGSQFTCGEYVNYLKKEGINISMDAKGRALDNIYIERFWRTLKRDHIYLNPADNGLKLYLGIEKWLRRYHNRDHQGIENLKPENVFSGASKAKATAYAHANIDKSKKKQNVKGLINIHTGSTIATTV